MVIENTISDPEAVIETAPAAVELPAEPGEDAPVVAAPPPAPEAPETPEVTIPFNVPESLRPKEPEAPGGQTAGEVEALRNENTELRRGQAETLRIQAQNKNATSIQDLTQQYINLYSLDETTAKFTATQVINERQQGEANLAQAEVREQTEIGRRNAAQHYGNQYSVDPSALINLDSPGAMEREAKWIVYASTNDKRVTAVERARVPDQHFASGGQGDAVTSDNIDALYIQHETEHPGNTSNPYEARYRTFLARQT